MNSKFIISDHAVKKYCQRVMGLDEDELTTHDKEVALNSIKREWNLAIPIGHTGRKIKKQFGHMVYVFDSRTKRIVTAEKFY